MLVFSLVVGIGVCYGIPLVGRVLLRRGRKGIGRAFAIGAAAFVISQLLIRTPILQFVLPNFTWYLVLPMDSWGYGLFLGLTAGLAEETARWIAMAVFLKGQHSLEQGLAFGLGHGGIEAMLLIGPNMIAGLGMVLTGQGAQFPADAGSVLVAGAERIFAFAFHVGASLLVMYGVGKRRAFRYWALALALHTVMDAAVVILPGVFGVGGLWIELYAAALGGLTLCLGILAWRREGSLAKQLYQGV